ncbi:hypothetical protein GA0070624_2028 [Micromonospora rhizosphaerae]|uniref:Rho termination factor, N-terminal domain n=1 Tax=Micromonospora rhizosphaerae TaxID=568872 RepID=A0A1C6RTU6_9ACTN|nr:SAP domain-containing protein [Micromonospora rhizosphaerae]SCL20553.1 hypothetical protein GA0070624_2028 [Micromonospora rhizosphaerae]
MTGPTPAALARVAEFLSGLSEAEVAALAEGRARLALLPNEDLPSPGRVAVSPAPAAVPSASPAAASTVDLARAEAALAAMARRDDGTAYLSSWTTRDLRELAAHTGLRGVTGLRKTELVDRIVDRTIGFRLNSAAIRQR